LVRIEGRPPRRTALPEPPGKCALELRQRSVPGPKGLGGGDLAAGVGLVVSLESQARAALVEAEHLHDLAPSTRGAGSLTPTTDGNRLARGLRLLKTITGSLGEEGLSPIDLRPPEAGNLYLEAESELTAS